MNTTDRQLNAITSPNSHSARLSFYLIALAAVTVATPAAAQQDALRVVNTLRTSECAQHLGRDRQLKLSPTLNVAAKHVKDGDKLRDALKRAGYRADQSAVIHIGGVLDDATLKRMLAKNYCATLIDPGLLEVGVFRSTKEIAFVFAAPFSPPTSADAARISQQVLQLVNDARAKPRRCGTKRMTAVGPLTLNDTLRTAALVQAKDMATRGRISHEGSDGSSPGDRATRAGYIWKAVGENVASGQQTAKEVVDGWLASPGHCVNIMDPDFIQMAVAYAESKREIGIYWAQVFGRPR